MILTGLRDRRLCSPRRATWGSLRAVLRQKAGKSKGEAGARTSPVVFLGTFRQSKVNSLGFVSLNNVIGLSYRCGLSCLGLGLGVSRQRDIASWSARARQKLDTKAS